MDERDAWLSDLTWERPANGGENRGGNRTEAASESQQLPHHPLRQRPLFSDIFLRQIARARRFVASSLADESAHGRAFLFSPVFIGAGAAWWLARPFSPGLISLILLTLLSALAAVSLRYSRRALAFAAAAVALFLAGGLLAQLETARRSTTVLDSTVTTHVTGQIEARERTGETSWRYQIQLLKTDDPVIQRPPERLTLVARGGDAAGFAVGSVISGTARLSPPSGPALPGLVDFAFLSYFDGIGAIGFFYGPPQLAHDIAATDGLARRMALAIEQLRDAIGERVRAVLPGESGAFANAIIIGERRGMADTTLNALRNAGLAHVIAISGLHMALAAGIFFASLRIGFALFPRFAEAVATKKIAAGGALCTASLYLAISGMQVSARRAFIMLAIMLIAAIFDRAALSLRNVAVAAIIVLFFWPSEVLGPSLQMSFAATAALISGYGLWVGRTAERGEGLARLPAYVQLPIAFLGGIMLTSLIGGVSTAPYALEHFHRAAPYGLLGNLLAMPVITLIVMPAGLMAMLTMPFGLDAPFLILMGKGLDVVISIARHVDALGGMINTGQPPRGFLLLFSAGFVIAVFLKTRLRWLGLLPIAASMLLFVLTRPPDQTAILIAENASLVAIVSDRVPSLSRSRPPSFIYDQWQQALRLKKAVDPLTTKAETAVPDADAPLAADQFAAAGREMDETLNEARRTIGRFVCRDKTWCIAVTPDGPAVAVITGHKAYAQTACDHAEIIITTRNPGFDRCRSGSFLVTPSLLRQAGALRLDRVAPKANSVSAALQTTKAAAPDPAGAKPRSIDAQGATDRNAYSERPFGDDRKTGNSFSCDGGKSSLQRSGCIRFSVTPAISNITRAWQQHRLYDWHSRSFATPSPLPADVSFSGSAG
ncbi:ComEC/Rec2 family competence protein [Martelella sp. HB161492]|uniref:ComEC/Rec2 family competence protein n=1 Tax=Martelella sp. HB161492 TaxID=2720726 RepID=UPI001590997F|nr:ComEC/Rec2 family competence protein [Martelella sp. HB161492]